MGWLNSLESEGDHRTRLRRCGVRLRLSRNVRLTERLRVRCFRLSKLHCARTMPEPDDGKNASPCLTQKAPYKGLGAQSEEKREPVSDIDTGVVDSLKVLDPAGRLEKRSSGAFTRLAYRP